MYKVTYIAKGSVNPTKSDLKDILKNNLLKMADSYHAVFVPKHFQPNASSIYHYDLRGRKWVAFCNKIYGNYRPLFASGQLYNAVMGNFRKTTNTNEGAVSVKISMNRGHPMRAEQQAELLKVNDNEVKVLMSEYKEGFNKDLAAIPETRG